MREIILVLQFLTSGAFASLASGTVMPTVSKHFQNSKYLDFLGMVVLGGLLYGYIQ